MIGVIAGAGRKDKPFLKAGNRAKYMQAHGRLYPTVRGIAQAAIIIHMVAEDISILVGNPQLVELLRQDVRLEIFRQERQDEGD